VATSLAGVLSNPLFNLANSAVVKTPMLQAFIARPAQPALVETAMAKTPLEPLP